MTMSWREAGKVAVGTLVIVGGALWTLHLEFAALHAEMAANRAAEIKEHGELKDLITPIDKRLVAVETKIEHVSDSCGPMEPQELIDRMPDGQHFPGLIPKQ